MFSLRMCVCHVLGRVVVTWVADLPVFEVTGIFLDAIDVHGMLKTVHVTVSLVHDA